ncbi:flavin reductase family protein [Ideonella sp. B508-1]|uniref:flavin reductase family protein n=1 Tax=Ideonella sp. B508-1 TaxID=137716 RepID=UPI000349B4B3|nr:flavin reductase family protein [Ideonella sp. B508-1]
MRHSYAPAQGHGLRHDPIAAILGPRPIGWISTVSETGVANLAPYSFFNIFNYKPPIVAFASVGHKDTVRNAQHSGEFVCNLATRALAEAMNLSSMAAPPEVSEFTLCGLTPRASVAVQAPAVQESPVNMECKVLQVQQLRNLQGQVLDTWMVLGEVVMVHIDPALLCGADGTYDTAAAGPILRGGGPADYFEVTADARFLMHRPK